ncbi:MAG: 16S rRNA (cytosine(1402)-N(4))-methyltransferase [Epsilonproteobacteria bacterium]|nr:MAG: 16S rRNA (cytosine(1402)-N(4))-methyltransferase [Campylobacterota bacterium]
MNTPHIPVLLNEVLKSFENTEEGYFVDCTLGYAGHSIEILEKYANLKHIGIDRDDEALIFSAKRLKPFNARSTLYKGTFSEVLPSLKEYPIVAILADFGVSSLQLDKKERGFSFTSETLDMRMDAQANLSAYEVANHYSQMQLEYIFDTYGEIRAYRKLAAAVIETRSIADIKSAKKLSEIAIEVLGKHGKIHPATLMFQAIRIEVNNELGEIEALLDALEKKHHQGAVLSLISFHSLEDRLVKNRFKRWGQNCICDAQAIRCTCTKNHAIGKMLGSKPIIASKEELKMNPRARSAKLRTFCFGAKRKVKC